MNLAAYMKLHSITPEQMANLVGDMSESGVRKWVYGERVPRPDQLRRIAEITNGDVTPNDFILADAAEQAPEAAE